MTGDKINPGKETKKDCAKCGTAFSCYSDNCWCDKLPNIIPLEEGKECMCSSCLEKAVKTKLEQTNA